MKNWKAFISVACAVMLVAGSTPVSHAGEQAGNAADASAVAVSEERIPKNAGELVIDDNSYNLDTIIQNSLGDSAAIKVGVDLTGVGQTVLPKQVTTLIGWKTGNFFEPA